MTVSELLIESMSRDEGNRYAGGMTAGEIDEIKEQSAALREKVRAKRAKENGAETPQG